MRRTPPVSDTYESVVVLSRALDQAGDAIAAVHPDQLHLRTPCAEWDVAQLMAHLVEAPAKFLRGIEGGAVDWAAPAPPTTPTAGAADFRARADDLIHHWHRVGAAADPGRVDWQTTEIVLHTWDLAHAIDWEERLVPEAAERALAFLTAQLPAASRGTAFAPAVDLLDDAPVHDRLAAFAGRDPRL
ncbi:TIGR03086 family protein [Nocardioides sp. zg-578]|nr:TIGR03086 family protein [Nocardioides marmotae]MTB82914.1 TIGR03086 family protein [Nocardioides marmotae]